VTTVVLADDHHVVRQGLRVLLEAEADLSVVADVAEGALAVEISLRLAPDVLILDLVMPGLDGLAVLRRLQREAVRPRIVVLSMHAEEAYVVEALTCGASAYVLKEATASDLVHAVREAAAGRRYLSPPLRDRAIEAYTRRAQAAGLDVRPPLTAREREVLALSAQGYTLTQVAARLAISPRTVEAHRSRLMHKLGLHNQTEVVRYAIRQGIVPAGD
jgi:DNA-binding NarL/FixJ family response regulator